MFLLNSFVCIEWPQDRFFNAFGSLVLEQHVLRDEDWGTFIRTKWYKTESEEKQAAAWRQKEIPHARRLFSFVLILSLITKLRIIVLRGPIKKQKEIEVHCVRGTHRQPCQERKGTEKSQDKLQFDFHILH